MHYFRFEISACGGLLSYCNCKYFINIFYREFPKIFASGGLAVQEFLFVPIVKRATFQFPNAFLFEPIYQLIKMKIMTDLVEIAKTEMQFFSENFSGHAKNIF